VEYGIWWRAENGSLVLATMDSKMVKENLEISIIQEEMGLL
jgi:hypothetical protein